MSSTAWYYPRKQAIDTTDINDELLEEIIGQYEASKDRDNPVFMCMLNKQPMYLRRHQGGRYFFIHWSGENGDGHRHESFSRMSEEHRRQSEYISRAAQSAGLEATLELSTGGSTRLDIGITGSANIGFEVQRSSLTVASAKTRAAKSFTAGWPTIWVNDTEEMLAPPEWFGHVPSARLVGGGWTHQLPEPETVFAMITEFSSGATGLNQSGIAITLDELVRQSAGGEIIPVIDPEGVVRLTRRGYLDAIAEHCDDSVLWQPNHVAKPRYKRTYASRGCDHEPPPPPKPIVFSRPIQWPVKTFEPQRNTAPIPRPSQLEVEAQQWLDAEQSYAQQWLDAEQSYAQQWLDAERRHACSNCDVCELPINPVFNITAHYDCARKVAHA